MSKRKYFLLLIGLLLLDQITKLLVKTNLIDSEIVLIEGVLKIIYHQNDGAVWGILGGKTLFITVMTILISSLVVWFFFKIPNTKRYGFMRLLSIFIIAGAFGNLIDRLVYGFVVDFIYFELINFPVFNIADCYITTSAVLMILLSFFYYKDDDFKFLSRKKKGIDSSASGDNTIT